MTRGYIFDYGGTLDTGGRHWGKVIWQAYRQAHVPVSEQQYREAYVHVERELGKSGIILPHFTFFQTLDAKLRMQLDYLGEPSFHSALLSGLYEATCAETARSREVLMSLGQLYPMALVSNFYGNLTTVVREFGLDELFQAIIDSAVVGIRKPDPAIFRLGIEALGLDAADVTVVGDSMSNDILPAKMIGCRTVWLKGEEWTDEPIDETAPDLIITKTKDVITTALALLF